MNEIWKDINGYEGLYQVSNKELAEKYGCTTELIATRKYQMKMRGVI